MAAPKLSNLTICVERDGRVTIDFLKFLQLISAMLDDHEARITALEP